MNSRAARELNLPFGYKFIPTDVELLQFYLLPKLKGEELPFDYIMDLDVFNYEPQQLAEINNFNQTKDNQIYFFSKEDESNNRTTPTGYWRVCHDNIAVVNDSGRVIGYKTKLVHDVDGISTEWKMTEFRYAVDPAIAADVSVNYIVCKIKRVKEMGVVEILTEEDE